MRAAAALAGLVLAGICVLPASAQSDPTSEADDASVEAAQAVNFVSSCRFSHRATDDPIVYPKQPGASHDHSFVGNTSTNAFSTLKSLLAAPTTCHRPEDTAAYWLPTLSVDGQPVAPLRAQIYYRRSTFAEVRPFPRGFRVIAGQAMATSPQQARVTRWHCGPQSGVPQQATVPTCPQDDGPTLLRLRVTFPNCWDGQNLDSPDHQGHAAYSKQGVCPSTHPVALPAITINYIYPTAGGPTAALASGGQFSGHADFVNAWQQAELKRLVKVCLNAQRHCARGG